MMPSSRQPRQLRQQAGAQADSPVWRERYAGQLPENAFLRQLANSLTISPAFAGLLWKRGFQQIQDMERFIETPQLGNLPRLSTWPDVLRCAAVLADACLAGRSILVWGDYDVDGITATALVADFLSLHGVEARTHIPSRLKSGYGLNKEEIEGFAKEGVELLLTVDCGVTDNAEVAKARECGMTVVISDHHLPGDTLPDAHALCNPRAGIRPAVSREAADTFAGASGKACQNEAKDNQEAYVYRTGYGGRFCCCAHSVLLLPGVQF
ncbi:hypothetical protein FACS1894168_2790 [Deltaproteobacteria bacterium]|nr:hypothetical protein FACS1894168_2790 [Deltaproteobacteria bacterium]